MFDTDKAKAELQNNVSMTIEQAGSWINRYGFSLINEVEALRHDLERYMAIANEHVNEAERLREALEEAPIISLWESKEDFRRRQDGWLKTKYRAALEQSK